MIYEGFGVSFQTQMTEIISDNQVTKRSPNRLVEVT